MCGLDFCVTSIPFTDARNRLSELIDEVSRTHDRVTITRHGHAVAVLISPDDLAALEETIEVVSRPDVMRQLAESQEAIDAGDVLDADELAALMGGGSGGPVDRPALSAPPHRSCRSTVSIGCCTRSTTTLARRP